ncbi:MAG: substrate-binding domain-containing protein [Acidobacteria bacterium]|nr:substrate-binding domain-containing protein [Acidobacteriota bacterium]MBI3423479.1 substrate-binding domain-containing protein [Acidobacteriota bacterium]
MQEPKPLQVEQPLWARLFPNNEWALLLLLLIEVAIFSVTGGNFLTRANGFELVRLSVEIGLLALALTPIIITGGIDLSVGSLLGLAAVVFGALTRKYGWPLPAAAGVALLIGASGGGLNAWLITRFGLPPLIVTLGSFSLFRGLAEGLTGAVENYTDFPASFLFLGQGYLGGVIPAQMIVLVVVALGYWALQHRTIIGRALQAIGYSPEGARYAGIPVERRLRLIYVLSGLMASVAALIYVAHLGQAKSDAGTGYELMAITAVVLGGTSIYGGRGTIWGTLFGLAALVVLQNGLRLSALPAELAGILTGVLLIGVIVLDRLSGLRVAATAKAGNLKSEIEKFEIEEFEMKNSQVAVICAAILGAALIIAGSNALLVSSLVNRNQYSAVAKVELTKPAVKKIVVGMMPKEKGDPYFISCRKGAEEAAQELGVELLWDGPTQLDAAKQNEVVEAWITKGVDVIAVSVENQAGISTVLRKARARGIKVLTWDADAQKDARDFLINQATPQGIGDTLTDEAARILNGKGEFAIITASLSAANQNEWIKYIKARMAEKHPGLKLVAIQPSDGDRDRAFTETQNVLKVYPNVKLVMAIAAPAVPGAAEAVKQSGRADVKVTGLSLPNMCKPYVHDGVIESIVLWDTGNLGYLTVSAARALSAGELKAGVLSLTAGKLGKIEVKGDEVMLGAPFIFNKSNIDKFDF